MVIMLLDHTREFTHEFTLKFDPSDLTQTSVWLFVTRWITHFCAPLFVFLAGMAVAFQQQRGKSPAEMSAFLIKRGLWLCLVELIVIKLLVFWQIAPQFWFVQVIWVLGISMICLAALIRIPRVVVGVVAAALVLGHNAFDGVRIATGIAPDGPIPTALGKLWIVLHQQAPFLLVGSPGPVAFVVYPLIPWMGVMALGWLLGDVYRKDAATRQQILLKLGGVLTIAFVLLRFSNVYGDPSEWSSQTTGAFTALSFLNTTKYPPSLLFLLMTIGPGLIALSWFERSGAAPRGAIARAFVTFGRVPMFFYLLQWAYAKTAGYLLSISFGKDASLFTQTFFEWRWNENVGFPLWVTYAAWIGGVVLLYFPCRWFAGVKARRRDWWLSYV